MMEHIHTSQPSGKIRVADLVTGFDDPVYREVERIIVALSGESAENLVITMERVWPDGEGKLTPQTLFRWRHA